MFSSLALLLLLQIRTQPHLGCCLAAATAAASAIHLMIGPQDSISCLAANHQMKIFARYWGQNETLKDLLAGN
jgi:hypothetical protein